MSNEDEDESDDDTPVKKWHEDDMGQKGEPFSEADMYIASKYIAEFPRWHETTSKDRWGPFAEKVFTWGMFFNCFANFICSTLSDLRNLGQNITGAVRKVRRL